jgi:hypothetical protein
MEHFTEVRAQFENAEASAVLVLPCFAGFLDYLIHVHRLLSSGQFNVKNVFCER